jgi:carbamoyl-phosphate synthase/aspartate carbamoyltransferase/dihydroorotase
MLLAVKQGRLTLDDLIARMHTNPARIYSLSTQPDTFIEVDTDTRYAFPVSGWQTKPGWSPFAGMQVVGRVERVTLRGQVVFEHGQVLAQPGSGRVI